MADAQANKSVYKRMAAKLGPANNGTGAINPATSTPPSVPGRKKADTSNGKSFYKRKDSNASSSVNDSNQSSGKRALPFNSGSGKKTHFAD